MKTPSPLPAVQRRRLRRRVADENRKRAPKACIRCKRRKTKCLDIRQGACQGCRQSSSMCSFQGAMDETVINDSTHIETESDAESSPVAAPRPASHAPPCPSEPTTGVDEPSVVDLARQAMSPGFLLKLRETFSLDPQPPAGNQAVSIAEAQVGKLSTTPLAESYRLKAAVDSFPPRPIADFLISVCIEHGTDSFFYFDQAQFLAEIEEFYADSTSSLRTDAAFVCLAHATFALGSQWTTLAKPRNYMAASLLPDDGDPGHIFYKQARSLTSDLIELPSLRSVQALYVLGVYLLPASAIGSAYVYLGLALRKAQALDLHLQSHDAELSPRESEIRHRIWWAIYSLDRSSTVKLNRPRSIHPGIITVPLPRHLAELDDDQKFNNIDHQIADAQIMLILDRVAETMEWPDTTTAPYLFANQLKEWKRSLPSSLRLENVLPHTSEYRATFHLHLNYYSCWIAMGKTSVVSTVRANLRYQFGRDPQPPRLEPHVDFLAKSCIKAARKILRLFEDLHRTRNLTRFSFTDFQGCSIAVIVVLLAGILQRDGGYESQVAFGLDCLSKMAEGNVAAKTGVGFVQALQSIAIEAADKLSKSRAASGTPQEALTTTAAYTDSQPDGQYHGWMEWLARQNGRRGFPTDHNRATPRRSLVEEPTASMGDLTIPESTIPDQSTPAEIPSFWTGAAMSHPAIPPPSILPSPVLDYDERTLLPDGQQAANAMDFSSALYIDDPAFLMGLTGLDVFTLSDFRE